ncbi:MAG: hypothetical protein ACRDV7_06310, partial [Acidimicrobiia bacterium]
MGRRGRAWCIVSLGAIAWLILFLVDGDGPTSHLALLAAGLVLGELLVLRLEDRSAVPLSFAVMLVLASSYDAGEFAAVVLCSELVAFFVVPQPNEPMGRVLVLLNRLAVGAATVLAYRGMITLLDNEVTAHDIPAALGVAAVAQVLSDMLFRVL